MTSVLQFGLSVSSRVVPVPEYNIALGNDVFIVQRLPTEPIGTTTVTFVGVNVNSEIRVYLPDGTEIAGVENCAADQVLSWSVYSAGSASNTVTVRIVHTAYKIKEFNFTSSLGNNSLPVQQERDPWYYNPA